MKFWLGYAAIGLAGCSLNPAHFPDVQPIPLLQKRGETQVAAAYQYGKGIQSSVAVAVTHHLAIFANGAYAQQDNCFDCSKEVTRHLELGVGAFRVLSNGVSQEFFLGGGMGRFKALGNSGKWDPSAQDIVVSGGKYQDVFLQGEIGRRGRLFDRAGSMRLSAFRYYDFSQWNGDAIALPTPSRHWGLFLEPAVTFRFGPKLLKANSQIGLSLPILQAAELDNQWVWWSFGLNLDIFSK
jgi:hypothetical protein